MIPGWRPRSCGASSPAFPISACCGSLIREKRRSNYANSARPDIILMDLVMPGIDGAETTRRIMHSAPCVILVVTATTVGNRDKVFEAMGHGALDAVNTPVLGPGQDMSGAEPLIQKLRTVARLVGTRSPRPGRASRQRARPHAPDTQNFPVVALGASTGGPQALAEIVSALPARFSRRRCWWCSTWMRNSLRVWPHGSSTSARMPVAVARHGEMLRPGRVWIAGSSEHLIYANGLAHYTPAPRHATHSPSIDVLFASLAQPHRAPRIGVLLTGMGRDGAEGLRAMRRAGALTIAQDASTSVVYGMPRAAAELKAAAEILPLAAIAPRICEFMAAYAQPAAELGAGDADTSSPPAQPASSIVPPGRGG